MKKLKKILTSRQSLLIIVPLLALTIGFSVEYAVVSNNKNNDQVSADCSDTCVALRSDKADPETITVTKGSYVQFNSADGKSHSLSLGNGGEEHSHTGKFSSGEFRADEAWKVQFNDEGSFIFHDHLNPKINVLVVVYTPGKDYKIQR